MIDPDGYRPNVGIVLSNGDGQVLLARRSGQRSWQFPQGGIKMEESPEDALYRELHEELGLAPAHVEVLGRTRSWLRYNLPRRFIRRHSRPLCIGQKQLWFLLRLVAPESALRLDVHHRPEFDSWKWVSYWQPTEHVIFFKRGVYRRALRQLEPFLPGDGPQAPAELESQQA